MRSRQVAEKSPSRQLDSEPELCNLTIPYSRFFIQVEPTAFVNTSRLPVANQFSMSALLILCHLTILGRAGEFRIFRTENGEHSLMPTVPRKMWVHYKTCSTSPVVAARCHTGSPLSALDMRLLRTQNSSRRTRAFAVVGHRPKSKEH